MLLVRLTLQWGFMTALRIVFNAPANLVNGQWEWKDEVRGCDLGVEKGAVTSGVGVCKLMGYESCE